MQPSRGVASWMIALVAWLAGALAPAQAGPAPGGGAMPAVEGVVVDADGRPVPGAEVFGAVDPGDEFAAAEGVAAAGPARADAEGRFRLDWPDRPAAGDDVALWALGGGLGLARVPAGDAGGSARVVLPRVPAPALAAVRVAAPGGEPVAGAMVRPDRWYEGPLDGGPGRTRAIPRPVADRLAARTGGDGRVVIGSIPAPRLAGVAVESAAGTQFGSWPEAGDARHRDVRLRPTGRVAGVVRGAGAGWTVRAATRAGGHLAGLAAATTDASGRFELPRVAAGPIEVRAEPGAGVGGLVARAVRRDLNAGAAVEVAVPTRRAARVGGVVRGRGAGDPVAGALVAVVGSGDPGTRRVRTGPDGRFAAEVPEGPVVVRVEAAPAPFLVPTPAAGRGGAPATPLAAGEGREWPPIELARGVYAQGRVVDAEGRPAGAGVRVEARWAERDGPDRSHAERSAAATTDAEGRFAIGPIPPGLDLAIAARRPDGAPGTPRTVANSGAGGSIEATVPAEPGRHPEGRVVDAEGRPVPHAPVRFRVAGPGGGAGARVADRGLDALIADEQGHFRGPEAVAPGVRLQARAEVDGGGPAPPDAARPWVDAGAGLRFPDLVVDYAPGRPAVVGHVAGTDGRPVAGVAVWDRAGGHAVTDDAGRFRLDGPPSGATGLLFARREGYRFAGRTFAAGAGTPDRPLAVTLIRRDEPPSPRAAGEAPMGDPISRAAVALLLRSLVVESSVERVLARRDPVATAALLEHLARVEPARVAAWLGAGVVADSRAADGLRRIAARHLAERDYDAAGPVVAAIEGPEPRCLAALDAIEAADLDADRGRAEVTRAEREARSVEDPGRRAATLARVADAWLDLGAEAEARRALDDAGAIADGLPRATAGSAAWCALIRPLARLDLGRAEGRLARVVDPAQADRCRLAVARDLAPRDPPLAARWARGARDRRLVAAATPELCHLMARRDPATARQLADAIAPGQPTESAYALGMMAAARAPVDRAGASTLLREAFDRLEAQHDPGPAGIEPALVAAALLPAVAAVDPALVPEFAWEAVALGARPAAAGARLRSAATLALLLAPYDPAAARALFDPGRLARGPVPPADLPALLLAATRLAPEVAARWVDGPVDDRDRVHLVAALTTPEAALNGHAARQILHLWAPEPGPAAP